MKGEVFLNQLSDCRILKRSAARSSIKWYQVEELLRTLPWSNYKTDVGSHFILMTGWFGDTAYSLATPSCNQPESCFYTYIEPVPPAPPQIKCS
jgi:hypothetical protein